VRKLTYKQRLFIDAYLGEANGNASEAARCAGYANPGQLGYQLLQKTSIRTAVECKLKTVAMSSDEILARVAEIATADIGEFLDIKEDGTYRLRLSRRKRTRLIRKLKVTRTVSEDTETETTDLEVRDPFPALVKLGDYHGLWDKDPKPPLELKEFSRKLKERLAKRKNAGNG